MRIDLAVVERMWWRSIPLERLPAALAIVDLVRLHARVEVSISALAEACGVSRTTTHRALADLVSLGVVHTISTTGGGGFTTIIRPPDPDRDTTSLGINESAPSGTTIRAVTVRKHEEKSNRSDSTGTSHSDVSPDSDLDLFGLSSDLRSDSDLPLRSSTSLQERTMSRTEALPQTAPAKGEKKPRLAADKIPDPYWQWADKFRERLIAKYPHLRLANQSWGGKGGTEKTGARAVWANIFRLMATEDKRTVQQVRAAADYLFNQPLGSKPFVVESAKSFRDKFDRIVIAISNSKSATGGAPVREFKTWTTEDDA